MKKVHEGIKGTKDKDVISFLKTLMMEIKEVKVKMGEMESTQKYELLNKAIYIYVQEADDQYYNNEFSINLIQK